MNMKKTIAAIAAGAVAVSAMATTVSALADTSLPYNLVKERKIDKYDDHKATFEYTINARPAGVQTVVIAEKGNVLTEKEYKALDKKYQTEKYFEEKEVSPATTTYICKTAFSIPDGKGGTIINVGDEFTAAEYAALGLTADYEVNFTKEETPAVKEYTAKEDISVKEDVEGGYPTALDLNTPGKVESIVIKVASSDAGEQNKIFTYSSKIDALNYNANLEETGEFTFSDELDKYNGQLTITVTTNVNFDGKNDKLDEVKEINTLIDNGTINATAVSDDLALDVTPVKLNAFTKGGKVEKVYALPFKTAIKNNANITRYLQEDMKYHNVGAVLNDAIENYESVTFTFNTATQGIAWTTEGKVNVWDDAGNQVVDTFGDNQYGRPVDGWAPGTGRYEEALVRVGGNADALTAIYSSEWWADQSYMKFDQHLYQGTNNPYGSYSTSYGSEGTGYTGFDWTGYNLFQGALVINENLTMSLAETDYFDWTATSLSFDWDAIMDGAMTSNDYAVYLHSMKLATSETWYWDNMVVTLTAGAAEDGVDAEAGVEADDEELTEEPVEEEVVEEEPAEEEVEVEVANPTTGNASVALAVIPVALAAAAVVAKKRS